MGYPGSQSVIYSRHHSSQNQTRYNQVGFKSTRFVPILRHLAPVRWRFIYLQMQSRNPRRSLASNMTFSSYIGNTTSVHAQLSEWGRRATRLAALCWEPRERERRLIQNLLQITVRHLSLARRCVGDQGRMAKKSSLSPSTCEMKRRHHTFTCVQRRAFFAPLDAGLGVCGVCFYEPGADWPRAHVRHTL